MEGPWAEQHLQIIRTLMERTAVYRRALVPTTLWAGIMGAAAAAAGIGLNIDSLRGFVAYWMAAAVLALGGAVLMMRRQAIRDKEVFWSPPARRVTQILLPPLLVGTFIAVWAFFPETDNRVVPVWLPAIWMALYGCGLHSAGFFMPQGIRLFGWIFIVIGGAVLLASPAPSSARLCHGLMGVSFGGLHLAYGAYLYITQSRNNGQ